MGNRTNNEWLVWINVSNFLTFNLTARHIGWSFLFYDKGLKGILVVVEAR